jgi:hypothetical protein
VIVEATGASAVGELVADGSWRARAASAGGCSTTLDVTNEGLESFDGAIAPITRIAAATANETITVRGRPLGTLGGLSTAGGASEAA